MVDGECMGIRYFEGTYSKHCLGKSLRQAYSHNDQGYIEMILADVAVKKTLAGLLMIVVESKSRMLWR